MRQPGQLDIRPSDIVLDVGSGQDPHPRANILCDKFVADSTERACGAGLLVDRPIVLADATSMPFPDGSFDFVFCSHLLEHMDDPAALLQELQRVGRRGYIETPSKVYEKLWGWDFHRWFVTVVDGRLLIESKDESIFDEDLNSWFSRQIEKPTVWRFFMKRLTTMGLLSTLVWDGDIAYEIKGEVVSDSSFLEASTPPSELDLPSIAQDASAASAAGEVKRKLASLSRRRSEGGATRLMQSLVCPEDRTTLKREGQAWVCSSCDRRFPVAGEVHLFV